jgi:hypothetical protein
MSASNPLDCNHAITCGTVHWVAGVWENGAETVGGVVVEGVGASLPVLAWRNRALVGLRLAPGPAPVPVAEFAGEGSPIAVPVYLWAWGVGFEISLGAIEGV